MEYSTILIIIVIVIIAIIAYILYTKNSSSTEGFTGVYGALQGTEPVKETFGMDAGKGGVVKIEYFYRPTCPHCVNYSPVFDKAAVVVNRDFPDIIVNKYDVTDEINFQKMNESTDGTQSTIPCVVLWYSNGGKIYLDQTKRNHIVEYVKHTESAW